MTDEPDDVVTLEVGDLQFTGWQDVRITCGVEVFPSSFVLHLTERLPEDESVFSIAPGDRCRVRLGADVVLTGYVDCYRSVITAKSHEITVVGRSATLDLVDCAAGVTSGQEAQARMTFAASTLLQLARDLCTPFGISVSEPDGEGTAIISTADGIPRFTIPLNATVFDVIEPLARWKQMMVLDGRDGNLVLAKLGTKKAASGFNLPGNVLTAGVTFDKQDRFSIYLPALFTIDSAFDVTAAVGTSSSNYLKPVRDVGAFVGQPRWDGKDRYRPHFVVSEQQFKGIQLAEFRANWEMARRFGRSQAVNLSVATWRDDAGTLWTPNTLASLNIPLLKLKDLEWMIAEVSYIRGLGIGTVAQLRLMPKQAFAPEPTFNTAFDPQIQAARDAAVVEQRGGRRDDG